MKYWWLVFGYVLSAHVLWANPFTSDARIDVVTPQGVRHAAIPAVQSSDHGGILNINQEEAFALVAPRCFSEDLETIFPVPRDSPASPVGTASVAARIAIETDEELRAKFPSTEATLDYLASILDAVTTVYERDLGVQIQFSYIRIWETPDPWVATSPGSTLGEFLTYWNDPINQMETIAGPHTVAHFISGKRVSGGVAFLDVLCHPTHGFGVSQVFGGFDLADPTKTWDVVVVAHELGHNFSSPHSHCYNPPIDHCYNQEQGCYAGIVEPTHGGLMSYCHLLAGGMANIDLLFEPQIVEKVGTAVARATCLSTIDTSTTSTSSSTSTSSTSSSTESTSSTSSTESTSSTSSSTESTSSTSSSTESTSSTSSSTESTSSTSSSTESTSSTSSSTETTSSSSSTSTSSSSTSTSSSSTTESTSSTSTSSTASTSSTSSSTASTSSTSSSSTVQPTTSTSSSTSSTSESTSSTSTSTLPSTTTSTTMPVITFCPCDFQPPLRWADHHEYVKCVKKMTRSDMEEGEITKDERHDRILEARSSRCGRHKEHQPHH